MAQIRPESPAGEADASMLELTRTECLELLGAHEFGRVAVSGARGVPVIRPVNYVFDSASQSVVFRTASGSKFHALAQAAHAAFEIDGIDASSRTGWSVIVVGVTEEVADSSELRRLGNLALDTWAPGEKSHWIRIRAWTVSGRRIVAQETESD